jgi:hypothetical protein
MNGPDTAVAPTAVSGPFSRRWQGSVVAVVQRQDRHIVRLAA